MSWISKWWWIVVLAFVVAALGVIYWLATIFFHGFG